MFKKSDIELLKLVDESIAKSGQELDSNTLSSALYISEQYIQAIIKARYFTDAYWHLILAEIIQTDVTAKELLNRIKVNLKRQNYDPKVARSILYILDIYINTAIKAKSLAMPYLKDSMRRFIARKLNCGEYAPRVEYAINRLFPDDNSNSIKENLGTTIANEIIAKRKRENS